MGLDKDNCNSAFNGENDDRDYTGYAGSSNSVSSAADNDDREFRNAGSSYSLNSTIHNDDDGVDDNKEAAYFTAVGNNNRQATFEFGDEDADDDYNRDFVGFTTCDNTTKEDDNDFTRLGTSNSPTSRSTLNNGNDNNKDFVSITTCNNTRKESDDYYGKQYDKANVVPQPSASEDPEADIEIFGMTDDDDKKEEEDEVEIQTVDFDVDESDSKTTMVKIVKAAPRTVKSDAKNTIIKIMPQEQHCDRST